MKIVKLFGMLSLILLVIGCSLNIPNSQKIAKITPKALGDLQEEAPKNINWQGYYHAVVPCYNCKGVDTWLRLFIKDGHCKYDLREKFLGKKNVTTKGGIAWLRDGAELKLLDSDEKYLFLGNGTITFIPTLQSAVDDAYTLEKYDVFENENATILVNPQSIQAGKMGGKLALKFRAITNFQNPTLSGYSSLRATYLLKCKARKFKMSRLAYYDEKFTMGNFVYPKENLSGKWFNVKNVKLMEQVRAKYCNR